MTNSEPLTFEEFSARDPIPRYNNLFLYFVTTGIGPTYKGFDHFKRFETEHPELEERVRGVVMDAMSGRPMSISEALRPCDQPLYEAYLKIREFADSDREIFA